MRKTTCTCDRCGREITNGVVYQLTCYAEDVKHLPFGNSFEAVNQNTKQNLALRGNESRDLCKECKDELTDGLFIV